MGELTDTTTSLELLGIGALVGLLSGLLGVGGGFLVVPLMVAIGQDIKIAIGTSAVYVAVTAASGAIRHARQGTVDLLLAGSLSVVAVGLAQAGALVGSRLAGWVLTLAFGVSLLAVAVWYALVPDPEAKAARLPTRTDVSGFLRRRRTRQIEDVSYTYTIDLRKAVVTGAAVGFSSGLLGVGGGFLLVPLVATWMRVPLTLTIGSTLVAVLPTAASAAVAHYRLGNIDFGALPPLIIGGVVAAQLGAWLGPRISHRRLRLALISVFVLGAINLVYNGVRGLLASSVL